MADRLEEEERRVHVKSGSGFDVFGIWPTVYTETSELYTL